MKYLILLALLSFNDQANVYKCEIDGVVTYSQSPCADDAELTDYKVEVLNRSTYKPFIATAYMIESEHELIAKAKLSVKALLKDPESAIFSELITTIAPDNNNKIGICGSVNAKNSFGGYTGEKPFTVIEGEAHIWDESLYFSGIDLNGSLKRQCYLKSN